MFVYLRRKKCIPKETAIFGEIEAGSSLADAAAVPDDQLSKFINTNVSSTYGGLATHVFLPSCFFYATKT